MRSSLFWIVLMIHLPLSAEPTVFLTQTERNWLMQLTQPIKIGITKIPNQVLPKKSGGYEGFSIDLFQRIQNELELNFKYIYFDSWNELLQAGIQKEVDIIFLMQKTSLRLHHFYFTDTVLSQKNKIIANKNNCQSDLKGNAYRVAVSRGSAIEEFLTYYYPELKLVPVANELEALSLVDQAKVDATVAGAVRASYYIQEQNFNHLCISDDLGYDYHLAIASRNDWPVLNIVLSKAINEIDPTELETLRLKWGYIDKVDPETIELDQDHLLHILMALGFFILPLSVYFYLNYHLKQITEAYHKALKELQAARSTIQHLKSQLK